MKNLYCPSCDNRVYFQNSVCLNCSESFGFDLEQGQMVALSQAPAQTGYKLCANGVQYGNCNWVVPATSETEYCPSCHLTEVIPNVETPGNLSAWSKIEEAKRRLVYNLEKLGLHPQLKTEENPSGLCFRFLEDTDPQGEKRLLTGHEEGIVTLNIIEADDVERERMRKAMGEPYRTLVGHLRHEVGHYYWDQLVFKNSLDSFRSLFGDESIDYGESLKQHYQNGPKADWSQNHISAYAAAHPWEDWAETWAHYLHMMDALGTAYYSRLKIENPKPKDPAFNHADLDLNSFDSVISHWPGVATLINSFNRSLGMPDAYPFTIPERVKDKLRFIHDLMPRHQGSA